MVWRLLAVAMILVGVAGCDDESSAPPPTPDAELSVHADQPWYEATLQRDGRTLVILVGGSPEGDGPCDQRLAFDDVQTPEQVIVGFEELHGPSMVDPPPMCPLVLTPQRFEIALDEPLGDRPVYDGVLRSPREIRDMAELVTVSYLPDDFRLDDASPGGGPNRIGWQQTFVAGGSDWYFAVTQGPDRGFLPPYGDPVGTTEVHGIEATVFEDPSGTIRTIRWSEGGLDLRVWGEMQGPPDFAYDAELLEIAEGVQLPD